MDEQRIRELIAERDAAQAELARLREFRAPDYAQIRAESPEVQHHLDSLYLIYQLAQEGYAAEKHARRAVETERDRLLALDGAHAELDRVQHNAVMTERARANVAEKKADTLRAQLAAAQAAVEQLRDRLERSLVLARRRLHADIEGCRCHDCVTYRALRDTTP